MLTRGWWETPWFDLIPGWRPASVSVCSLWRARLANFASISGIPASAQMAARAMAPVGAGVLVTWLGGYTSMMQVLVAIAIVATVAMAMFALSARPLRM